MYDQLIIGEKASYDDFSASISKRKIGDPKKKKITKTIPFSNVTYDFSKINGEIYWEQRELEYKFEMIANSPEELEALKSAFSEFVMSVIEEDIHDPFIRDYHFNGTFESIQYDDDDGMEKTTATVKFLAYPYKIANRPKEYNVSLVAGGEEVTAQVVNDSSHRITPTITVNGSCAVIYGNYSTALSSGTYAKNAFSMEKGVHSFHFINLISSVATIKISFTEEVF